VAVPDTIPLRPTTAPGPSAPAGAPQLGGTVLPAVYTADQVAALLQIDRATLERRAAAGKVPGRLPLPGRAVRYRRDVIDQWIQEGCQMPASKRRR